MAQTVTGASLDSITYAFADAPANTQLNKVTPVIGNGAGKTVTVTTDGTKGGTGSGLFTCTESGTAGTFDCPIDPSSWMTGVNTVTVTVS